MRSLRLLPWLFSLASTPLVAQTYTAGRIQFSDRGTFTQQQLEDAVGMHAGTSFTASDLGAAAQHLIDTGYFDDAGATLDGKIAAITVKFATKPADLSHLAQVGFDNFIWLTHDEIEAAIKTKFPLFNRFLSENSPGRDDIKAALVAALAAKSIDAVVAYETFEPTLRNPARDVRFRIAKPSIRIANVHLAGVTQALVPLVQKSVNAAARTAYAEDPAGVTTSERILAPLLDAGYVQATLTDVVPVPSAAENGIVPVVLQARLVPGEIFHVSSIAFSGTPLLSADAFNAQAKLHAGDVASRHALLETRQRLKGGVAYCF
jgi:outer membrane protein assembly factor BamA